MRGAGRFGDIRRLPIYRSQQGKTTILSKYGKIDNTKRKQNSGRGFHVLQWGSIRQPSSFLNQ